MKKSIIIVFILTIFVLTTLFTGCDLFETKTDEYGFFANEELGSISDMPKIRSNKPTKIKNGTFYYTTTQEEFDKYLNSLYEYFVSKEYDYLGTPVKIIDDTFFGASPRCEIELGENLEDFLSYHLKFYVKGERSINSYFFVLGNELAYNDEAPDGYTRVYGRYIRLAYLSRASTDEDGFTYNAYITLPHGLYDYSFYLPKTISNETPQE